MWLDPKGRAQLKKLQEQIQALEDTEKGRKATMTGLEADWELWLDKINRAIARLNARTRAASATENEGLPPDDTQVSPTETFGTHAHLAARRARRGY